VQYLCSYLRPAWSLFACFAGHCWLAVAVRLLVGGGSVAVVVLCSLASVSLSPSCCFGAVVVLCSSRFGAVRQYLCSLAVAVRLLRCLTDLLTRPPNSYSHLAVSVSPSPRIQPLCCRLVVSGAPAFKGMSLMFTCL
jgi:hypothetical protein